MIHINLVPPEYALIQARKDQQIIFGAIAAMIFLVMLFVYSIESSKVKSLAQEIEKSEIELKRYQAVNEQIASIESTKRQLTDKRDVISNLNRSRLIYPVLFEDLLPLIPSDIWVSEIRFVSGQAGSQMGYSFSCRALSNYAVATFLTNLGQSTHFSNTKISPISYENTQAENGQVNSLTFQLSTYYQHQGPMPLSEFN